MPPDVGVRASWVLQNVTIVGARRSFFGGWWWAFRSRKVFRGFWGPREIVPILLHSSRQREQGYNQSELIARELSRSGFGRLSTNLVVRIRATSSQTALDTQERRENVAGAFSVKGSVEDKHIWLVDDVVTMGATVNACAEALLVAGASSVDVMAVACPYGED